jgi:hypothetical protein
MVLRSKLLQLFYFSWRALGGLEGARWGILHPVKFTLWLRMSQFWLIMSQFWLRMSQFWLRMSQTSVLGENVSILAENVSVLAENVNNNNNKTKPVELYEIAVKKLCIPILANLSVNVAVMSLLNFKTNGVP